MMIIYNDNLQIIRLLTSEIAKMNIKLRHVDIAQYLTASIDSERIDRCEIYSHSSYDDR